MTDFSAPSIAEAGSQFDVTNIDQTVQQIQAVNRSWRLPALPDEVSLDIAATPGMNPDLAVNFLRGIDDDLNGAQEEVQEEPDPITFRQLDQGFDRDGFDQLRVFSAGVANQPAPTDPTEDAVKRFKEAAIRRGLMERPPSGVVDSTWSPEMNSVRYEMARDEWNERWAGDRPGAAPVSSVMEQLEKWTSPAGLLAAATELDLFWDFGAVSNEFSSWGDKWRKLQDASNPLDFGAKLVDAVTGPIDDIVMPIVNVALVGSGVGSLTLGARGAMFAAKGGRLVSGLYSTMNVRSAANVKALGDASWTASKLLKSSGGARRATGAAMKAWREAGAVTAVKAPVQAGMRLGFASQAQDLLPGYQGGLDLAGSGDNQSQTFLGAGAERVKALGRNPVFLPVEIMVAPYNIFQPGTFFKAAGVGQGLVSKTASGLYQFGGTAAGRATAGAVAGAGIGTIAGEDVESTIRGAVAGAAVAAALPLAGKGLSKAGKYRMTKLVGSVGDFLQHTSYKPLVQDQRITNAFHQGMLRGLDGDELATYQRTFDTDGFHAAMKSYMGTDDDAVVDSAIAFITTSASIDATAAGLAGGKGAAGFRDKFYRYRNKLISQLRTFDINAGDGSVSHQELAAAVAMRYSENPEKFAKVYQKTLSDLRRNPAAASEIANQQNRIAAQTMRQIMSSDGALSEADLVPGINNFNPAQSEEGLHTLEAYLPEVLPTLGRWTDFSTDTREISRLHNLGLFDGATFKPAINPRTGAPMRGAEREIDHFARAMEPVDEGITNTVFRDLEDSAATLKILKSKNISVAAQSAPGGRVTVARLDTPTKHMVREEAARLDWLDQVWDHLDSLDRKGLDLTTLDTGGRKLTELEADQVKNLVRAAGKKAGFDSANGVLAFARRRNIDVADVRRIVLEEAEEIANNHEHWRRFGLDEWLKDDANKFVTDPRQALKMRRNQLNKQQRYTAGEIDVTKTVDDLRAAGRADEADELELLAEGLAARDYKLVYGREFMTPHDLASTGSFADMSVRNAHAATIGNAFKGKMPFEAHTLEVRRQRLALQAALSDRAGKDLPVEDDMISNLLSDLRALLEENHERSNALIDHIHNQSLPQRVTSALRSSSTPLRLEDLSKNKGEVLKYLTDLGYDQNVAEAAWLALPRFRNAEFKDLGLYSFEAKLRQRNQLVSVLKFAGNNSGAVTGAAVGGYAGMRLGGNDPNATEEGNFGEKLLFGAAGAVAGGLGTKYGVGKGARALIPRAEMFKYGYMADGLVRARDAMRFTLSPFFDLSRYCLAPDTKVLTEDLRYVPVGSLRVGDKIAGFDEDNPAPGMPRRWRSAEVTETGRAMLPSYRVKMADGTAVECSEQHKWLVRHPAGTTLQWVETSELFDRMNSVGGRDPGNGRIIQGPMKAMKLLDVWGEEDSRRGGYLAGMWDGEGSLSGPGLRLTMAQRQNQALEDTKAALADLGFQSSIAWKELDGYDPVATLYIKGGLAEHLKFIGQVRPGRILDVFKARGGVGSLGRISAVDNVEFESIEYLGEREVVTLGTSTHTLVAEGFAHHNTEGQMLAQTAAPLRLPDGSKATMPLDMSPTGVRRRIAKTLKETTGKSGDELHRAARNQFDEIRTEFRQAAVGDFDPEVLDSTGKWFSQVGIMGFNPTDWMAGAFAELKRVGFDSETAYKSVREMYTYGTRGRSAAELSVNFVFFPFSFQKKALGHAAKWVNDDLARSLIIHDAFKTYEVLNERYDLNERWRDHFPVLQNLRKLNMLAFGLSPGRLGGINAPYLEAAWKAGTSVYGGMADDPAAALFMPVGAMVKDAAAAAELQRVVRSLTPAINDINYLVEDMKEQGEVAFSEAHLTSRAQVREGYAEWNQYRNEMTARLEAQGLTWSDLYNKEYMAPQRLQYELKRAEIGSKYPGWLASRQNSTYNTVSLEMEKNDRLARAAAAQAGGEAASFEDVALAQMEQLVAQEKQRLSYYGVEVGGTRGWEAADPSTFETIQSAGVALLRQNPKFGAIWHKFYRSDFGLLEAQI